MASDDIALLLHVENRSRLPVVKLHFLEFTWPEDDSQGMALSFEGWFGQTLCAAVIEDALDARAELFNVLDEEENIGDKFVPGFRIMRASEILDRHAFGQLSRVPDFQPGQRQ